ncbi:MAG: hypothetical protein Q8R44_07380 [Novosphingobium sp.]|nr:hypothetical protein [Novosphingobium sp.]
MTSPFDERDFSKQQITLTDASVQWKSIPARREIKIEDAKDDYPAPTQDVRERQRESDSGEPECGQGGDRKCDHPPRNRNAHKAGGEQDVAASFPKPKPTLGFSPHPFPLVTC